MKKIYNLMLICCAISIPAICNAGDEKNVKENVLAAEHIQGNGGDFLEDIRYYGRQIYNYLLHNYPSEFPVQIDLVEFSRLVEQPIEIIPLNARPSVNGKEKSAKNYLLSNGTPCIEMYRNDWNNASIPSRVAMVFHELLGLYKDSGHPEIDDSYGTYSDHFRNLSSKEIDDAWTPSNKQGSISPTDSGRYYQCYSRIVEDYLAVNEINKSEEFIERMLIKYFANKSFQDLQGDYIKVSWKKFEAKEPFLIFGGKSSFEIMADEALLNMTEHGHGNDLGLGINRQESRVFIFRLKSKYENEGLPKSCSGILSHGTELPKPTNESSRGKESSTGPVAPARPIVVTEINTQNWDWLATYNASTAVKDLMKELGLRQGQHFSSSDAKLLFANTKRLPFSTFNPKNGEYVVQLLIRVRLGMAQILADITGLDKSRFEKYTDSIKMSDYIRNSNESALFVQRTQEQFGQYCLSDFVDGDIKNTLSSTIRRAVFARMLI